MKAVTVKAVVGIKEVLEACMNLTYPPQWIVLIGQQLDLVRVVCLAEEAEFFRSGYASYRNCWEAVRSMLLSHGALRRDL